MKRIYQIVDTIEYVTTNSFQQQLLTTLRREADVITVPLDLIGRTPVDGRTILSTLKLRSVVRHLPLLKSTFGDASIFIYDQDPWESFVDEGSFRGSYKTICDTLNVSSFLTPSQWWSDYIRSSGHSSTFVKMWLLPELTRVVPVSDRKIHVGFMGQLHPFRKEAFEKLSSMGLAVTTLPGASYEAYLQRVSIMKFFIHDEPKRWHIDGKLIDCNGLYGKEAEVIGSGCFCLRNRLDEAKAWGLDKNPLLLEFSSLEELIEQVRAVDALDIVTTQTMVDEGVEMIRTDYGWKTVLEAL